MDPSGKKVAYRPLGNYSDNPNRLNPLEPYATVETHPQTSKQLPKPTKEHFLGLLLHDNVEASNPRPAKRRKSGVTNALELPGLPVIEKHGTQRLRIPPTLSGLHQPPPDAGLLPSMSTEQPPKLVEEPESANAGVTPRIPETDGAADPAKKRTGKGSRKHKKWSESETVDLLKGVAKFGIGKWTLILNCPDFHFEGRTALDLKDRFRVCCPDAYKHGRSVKSSKQVDAEQSEAEEAAAIDQESSRSKRSNRMSTVELERLGIDAPFKKSKRRQRTEWDAKEDSALLEGFKVHNNSWAAIRDSTPVLKTRTTTDLRDRLRTRFPEEYAKAGLTPRPAKPAKRVQPDDLAEAESHDPPIVKDTTKIPAPPKANDNPAPKKQPQPTAILYANDVFWGASFEPDGSESEPITLDRGILDWPYDQRKAAINHDATGKGASIDPLATLNLPRPTPTTSANGTATAMLTAQQNSLGLSASNALPSVAALTAVPEADDFPEHLELPSLIGVFGSLETDGRSGGHFMSMDELLS